MPCCSGLGGEGPRKQGSRAGCLSGPWGRSLQSVPRAVQELSCSESGQEDLQGSRTPPL